MHFANLDALWLLTLSVQPAPAGADKMWHDYHNVVQIATGFQIGVHMQLHGHGCGFLTQHARTNKIASFQRVSEQHRLRVCAAYVQAPADPRTTGITGYRRFILAALPA